MSHAGLGTLLDSSAGLSQGRSRRVRTDPEDLAGRLKADVAHAGVESIRCVSEYPPLGLPSSNGVIRAQIFDCQCHHVSEKLYFGHLDTRIVISVLEYFLDFADGAVVHVFLTFL